MEKFARWRHVSAAACAGIGLWSVLAMGLAVPDPEHLDMASGPVSFAVAIIARVRIGIHTGPVIAGVIGKKKLVYDLWGDTVNTASRMESHGVEGRIQVSGATRALLEEKYELVPRGAVQVKGKGAMETWFLEGRRAASAQGTG